MSEKKLLDSQKLLDANFFEQAILSAYSSMFHLGRALLFNDGISEKSHYCLIEYLRQNYVRSGKISQKVILLMDTFRLCRHDVMYGLVPSKSSKEDAISAINNAKDLRSAVIKILGK